MAKYSITITSGAQGPQGLQGSPGAGFPSGGTTNQVLKKISDTDYDTMWADAIDNDVAAVWGNITGTLSDQTDLQNTLNLKIEDITGESIKDLSDVYSSMAPTDGQILTYDTTNGWQAEDAPVSGVWGLITGTLSDQTDLQSALDGKAASSHTHVMADITDSTWISDITGSSIKDLNDVYDSMIPSDGEVLTYSTLNGWTSSALPPPPAGGAEQLNELTDVSLSGQGKGSILAANSFAVFQNLNVGTDGQVLTADSAETLGVKWADASGGISNVVEDTTPQLGGDLDLNGNAIPLAFNNQTGSSYITVASDAEKIITMNNASANTVYIGDGYAIGTKITVMQLGSGQTSIYGDIDTVNVEATYSNNLNGQYAIGTAVKIADFTWVLFGNLEVA